MVPILMAHSMISTVRVEGAIVSFLLVVPGGWALVWVANWEVIKRSLR